MKGSERIIFAMDVGSIEEVRKYLKVFAGEIGAVKLGKEVLTHQLLTGEPIIQAVFSESDLKVMWDLKYHDIPATMAGAAAEIAKYGQGRILGFTVHCLAGKRALEDSVLASKNNFPRELGEPPMVIGVTLLTSLDQEDLTTLEIAGTSKQVVLRWAKLAQQAGVQAIVCSPQETTNVLELNPSFKVINPGIRFAGSDLGTQKRVTTPGDAIRNRATYIVMGSDLRKGDPVANARRAAAEIDEALESNK